GHERPRPLRQGGQPNRDEQTDEAADAGDRVHPRRFVALAELGFLDRLGRHDGDVALGDAGGAQAVDGPLRRIRIGVQRVDRFHGFVFHNGTSSAWCTTVAGNGCSPTLSSQTEMIGTSFEKSTYNSPIAANVDTVIMISTGRGW